MSFSFQTSEMNTDQANSVWEGLRLGIKEIQNGNASTLRFEELYRNAYTLVLHKHGQLLYDGVQATIIEKLKSVYKTVHSASNETLLATINREWTTHKLIMTMIRDILMYMDKTYCDRLKKTLVYDLGFLLFKEIVINGADISKRLNTILLESVRKERDHEVIDRALMRSCLLMLVEVNIESKRKTVYIDVFEKDLLEETRDFYNREAQEIISTSNVPDYLIKIEQRILEEESRVESYLHESSRKKILSVVDTACITRFSQDLVMNEDSGVAFMCTNDRIEDLKRMFRLYSRVPETLAILREEIRRLVKESGESIITDDENRKNPRLFVQQVLDLRRKYYNIVAESFNEDRAFARALKEGFEYFINLDARAAQYLSLYIDMMLRMGMKDLAEDRVETKLEEVITIFRYLSDKDVFEDFYKQNLAVRLLNARGISDDVEKLMITKLKAECGHQFTSKLEGMFKNIELSKEINLDFARYLEGVQSHSPDDVDLPEISVNVLTSGFWPFSNIPPCNLPKGVMKRAGQFRDFYFARHSGHRLTWNTNSGTAQVLCQFAQGKKELILSTYGMVIMMLFNEKDTYTYQEIIEQTGIPQRECLRHLLSLAHPKVRILKKTPNTRKAEPTHKFTYNTDFVSRQYLVKVPMFSLGEDGGEGAKSAKGAIPPHVQEERKNRVEAAIVRIMKARQRLDHNNLVTEVCKQLSSRFPAEPGFIKKRIESLIEREYLSRDPNNRKLYEYLA